MLKYEYEKLFLGKCAGIGLRKRDVDDLNIVFNILYEDDENWFEESGKGFSSYWLPDLIEQSQLALNWMKENANCEEYGYSFKHE